MGPVPNGSSLFWIMPFVHMGPHSGTNREWFQNGPVQTAVLSLVWSGIM